uniref:thioredoxin-dependent peroxiredoxin n=1 Tax=Cyanothece sp. (strain PCC 7425 / ATCC 29141) TaxID=395961 RepID=B8HPM0_CYAP4
MTLNPGDSAPDFTLADASGNLVSLAALRGKWVILYFYPRDNTPGCTKEACGFREIYGELQQKNVVLLGVSGDDARAHQKFAQKYDLPFPLLCDPEALVAKAYESYGPKKFMGKELQGIYRQTFILDPEGKIARIYRKVKPDPHPAEVLAELDELLASEAQA